MNYNMKTHRLLCYFSNIFFAPHTLQSPLHNHCFAQDNCNRHRTHNSLPFTSQMPENDQQFPENIENPQVKRWKPPPIFEGHITDPILEEDNDVSIVICNSDNRVKN